MNTPQKAISAYVLKTLVDKLRPERFPGMPLVAGGTCWFSYWEHGSATYTLQRSLRSRSAKGRTATPFCLLDRLARETNVHCEQTSSRLAPSQG